MKFGKWAINPKDIEKLGAHTTRMDKAPDVFVDAQNMAAGKSNMYFSFEGTCYRICQGEPKAHRLVTTQSLKKLQAINTPEPKAQPLQRPFERSYGQPYKREFNNTPRWQENRRDDQQPFRDKPRNAPRFAGPK